MAKVATRDELHEFLVSPDRVVPSNWQNAHGAPMTYAVRPRVLIRSAKTEFVDDTFADAEQLTHGTAELTIDALSEEDDEFFKNSASVLHAPTGKSGRANVRTAGEGATLDSQSPSSGISSQTMTINKRSSCFNDGTPKGVDNIGPARRPAQPSNVRQERTSPGEPTSRSANFANGEQCERVQAENVIRLDTTKKYARLPANRQDGYWEQQRRSKPHEHQSKPQFWGKRSEQQPQRTKANEHGQQNAPNGPDEISSAVRNPFRRRAKTNAAPHTAGPEK